MPLSMYDVSVPAFLKSLKALSAILDKAAAHAAASGIDPKQLVEARLAPDMFAFARQVQIATDHAKGAAARLSGREIPKYEDTETTFDALKARIARTVDFLSGIPAAEFDGSEDREVVLTMRSGPLTFEGRRYLLGFALPNFYFHVTTAYDILRREGVPLGKPDFIGGL